MASKCGECLINDVEVIELQPDGVCPRCGTDYRPKPATAPKLRDVIEHEYRDSDGSWIDLRAGWQNGDAPGRHAIVEDAKKAARAKVDMVKPCACDECRRLLAK